MLWIRMDMGSADIVYYEMDHTGWNHSLFNDDSIFTTSLQETGIWSTRAYEGEGQEHQY